MSDDSDDRPEASADDSDDPFEDADADRESDPFEALDAPDEMAESSEDAPEDPFEYMSDDASGGDGGSETGTGAAGESAGPSDPSASGAGDPFGEETDPLGGESAPPGEGGDPFAGFGDREGDPFEGPGSVFESAGVESADPDEVWERLTRDGPAGGAEADDAVTVSKHSYCEGCEHFSAPPDARCTHEGTEILEFVGVDDVRLANCPVVAERRELEDDER